VAVQEGALSSATVTINAAQSAAVRAASGGRPSQPPGRGAIGGLGGLLVCLLLGSFSRARRVRKLLAVVAAAVLISWAAACGGGSSGGGTNTPPGPPATPSAQTYTVLVSGTSGGMIHNATITVTVK
jgi:hypothetical protein